MISNIDVIDAYQTAFHEAAHGLVLTLACQRPFDKIRIRERDGLWEAR